MAYINKKINKALNEIPNLEVLSNLQKNKTVFVVICGRNDTAPQVFNESERIISQHEDLDMFYTVSNDVQNQLNCVSSNPATPRIAIVKQFDEKLVNFVYTSFNSTEFEEWISTYSTPIILELTNENIQLTLNTAIPTVMLIVSNNTSIQDAHNMLYEQAKSLRRKAYFMVAQNNTDLAEKVLEYYQVNKSHIPTLLGLIAHGENNMTKFKYEGEVNRETAERWVHDLINNKLERYLQSEPIPLNPLDDSVHVVVGKNFYDVVLNNNNDVMLEIYAPWCGHCKSFAPKYARLAKKLVNNKNLVIAKMDGTANEYEGLAIESFPTILFYKAGSNPHDKLTNVKHYEGDRNVKEVLSFLKNETLHPVTDVQTLENEEEIEKNEKEEEEATHEKKNEEEESSTDTEKEDFEQTEDAMESAEEEMNKHYTNSVKSLKIFSFCHQKEIRLEKEDQPILEPWGAI